MSKQWKQNGKIMVSALIIIALLVGVIPFSQPIVSEATTVQTQAVESHDVTNGDFESGRVGYSVRGWELTAMKNGLTLETNQANIDAYLGAYEFVTSAKEDGDRIASLTKTGNGYVAMTSEVFTVEGGASYRISYNYCLDNIINKRDSLTNKDFQGISVMIKEISDDNAVTWTKLDHNEYGSGLIATENYNEVTENGVTYHTYQSAFWNTVTKEFSPASDTVSAQLYIRVGMKGKVTGTILLDDVCVDKYTTYDVPNGDFNSITHEADGGREEWSVTDTGTLAEATGVAGWTSISCKNFNGTKTDDDTTMYHKNYVATVVTDGDDSVMKYTYKEDTSTGNAWIQSSDVAVKPGSEISVGFRYKIDGCTTYKSRAGIFFYDKDGNEISRTCSKEAFLGSGPADWTSKNTSDDGNLSGITVPDDAVYVKVGFLLARRAMKVSHNNYETVFGSLADAYKITPDNGDAEDITYDVFSLYVDDVSISVTGEYAWTAEACDSNGKPSDTDVTDYYAIEQLKEYETGHGDAWQLSVTDKGSNGVAVFYTNPVAIDSAETYTTSFDYKIEGIDNTNGNRIIKVMYLFRYLDASGNLINGSAPQIVFAYRISGFSADYEKANTGGWITEQVEITNIPANAKKVQIGLTIGTNGAVSYDKIKNLKYSWDNMVLMETEAHEEYIKDSAVTASSLYKKTALFAGGAVSSDIAAYAQSYSEMQVTDACDDQKTVREQLAVAADSTYDYLFLHVGEEDLEELLANASLCCGETKIVCLLISDNAEYLAVAETVASKWNVTVVPIEDNAELAWQQTIEPAETASSFNCYEVEGYGELLTNWFDEIEATGVSATTDMTVLEGILDRAVNCPDTDDDYAVLSELVSRVRTFITAFDDLRPQLKGATIALNDPNQLQFLAIAPKQPLTGGVTVKRMGVAVTDNADFSALLDTNYVGTEAAYGVLMKLQDVDPAVEYTAKAYIVYQDAEGEEYIYYSNNDYVNKAGEITVTNGECTKSVYEIARTVALKLATRKGTDFSAIGGVKNKKLIATATTETEISLHNVYQMLGNNADALIAWLSEGGAAQ